MNPNYFFIDGSALTAQIRRLQREQPIYVGRKLCAREFMKFFMEMFEELHGGSYRRTTFYFPIGDEEPIRKYIDVPDHNIPGVVRDLHFKFCGSRLKGAPGFDKFVEEKVPQKFQGRFSKSEKGIDTEICCDALRLASRSSLERLFLFTNDADFIPLCRTLKEFGSNVSIIHLSKFSPNSELLKEADSYDVVPQHRLDTMFVPIVLRTENPSPTNLVEQDAATGAPLESQSEKPEAEPSDMVMVDETANNGSDDEEVA